MKTKKIMQCPIIKSFPLQDDGGSSLFKNVSCIYYFKNAKNHFSNPKIPPIALVLKYMCNLSILVMNIIFS
jgi:hypothetical protein